MPSKPTQEEMTEILARFMGYHKRGGFWRDEDSYPIFFNPFTDRNTIARVEARLSDEQRKAYVWMLLERAGNEWGDTGIFAIRHASPAICAEALARTVEPGRFEP